MEKSQNSFTNILRQYTDSRNTVRHQSKDKGQQLKKGKQVKKAQQTQKQKLIVQESVSQLKTEENSNSNLEIQLEKLAESFHKDFQSLQNELKEVKRKCEVQDNCYKLIRSIHQSLEMVKNTQNQIPAYPYGDLSKLKMENLQLRAHQQQKEDDLKRNFQKLNEQIENQAETIEILQKEKQALQNKTKDLQKITSSVPVFKLADYKQKFQIPYQIDEEN